MRRVSRTLLDKVSVNEVLEDIFKRWNIGDETFTVNSDNAAT